MSRLATSGRACLAALCGVIAASSGAGGGGKPLKESDLERIRAAAPEKATAKPKKPRRLLVFSRSPGYKHSSAPHTSAAIRIIGEKTGAYETVVSDDVSMFEPGKLLEFDAVVMNNTCGKRPTRELFLPADMKKLTEEEREAALARDRELKRCFAAFVRSGGGLVGFHGCTGAFFEWPEYGEMLGGYFAKHPWNQEISVKLDDPEHPVLAAFEGQPFTIREETYEVREPYSRDKVRVLLTLDVTSVDASKGSRKDGDYALAWVKRHGEGRVFYSAFSHYAENFRDPKMLRFYLDGIQFALGDLAADATPSSSEKGSSNAKGNDNRE